jgi:hypothetical protein
MISWFYDDDDPKTPLEEHLIDLLQELESRVAAALQDEFTHLKSYHPKDVIVMMTSNIIVHLLSRSLSSSLFVNERINLVEDCTEEIKEATMKLWTVLETSRVDVLNPH